MKNAKSVLLLLTPSWLTTAIGITLGVLTTLGVFVLARYQGSQLHQEIFELHNKGSQLTPSTYSNITTNFANNHILGVAPLFIVWACVGLAVYFLTIAIVHAFSEARALHEQLDYVHVSRQELIRQAILQFTIRLTALIGWFIFIKVTISFIVPYVLLLTNIAAVSVDYSSIAYVLLALAVVYANIYAHTVFLRLIVLRPRLFHA